MAIVSMTEILKPAFTKRYGVGAFNIVNDLSMEAILAAAEQSRAPVIIQVSVKTAKTMGVRLIRIMFAEMAGRVSIPATLHLDHCPDAELIRECLEEGWNSVLFDASLLSYEENMEKTMEVVALARKFGAAVEGELEAVKGVEDGMGSEEEGAIVPLDKAVKFIRETRIDSFAPAIGTAHGMYKGEPRINFERVSEIVGAQPIPIVLHGGTGLSNESFRNLISRGAVKVNISTQLKITYADSYRNYLNDHPAEYNPLKLLAAVRYDVM
ncbi:MAG: ketose-bisphosphate aldolase, partial [bacterium]